MADPVDALIELAFPLGGLHEGSEYQEQPAGTAAGALNVRAAEPGTLRLRGGSRSGLSRFLNDPVDAGHLIQHVTTIVTTGIAALSGGLSIPLEQFNIDYQLDPSDGLRNPGWIVAVGGTGVQPNRNVPTGIGYPEGITHQQSKGQEFAAPGSGPSFAGVVTLNANVTLGSLVVASVKTSIGDEVDLADSQNNLWRQIKVVTTPSGSGVPQLQVWATQAKQTGPLAVTSQVTNFEADPTSQTVSVLNYTGAKLGSPAYRADADLAHVSGATGNLTLAAGSVNTLSEDLVLGFFAWGGSSQAITVPPAPADPDLPTYTERLSGNQGMYVSQALPVKSALVMGGPATPTVVLNLPSPGTFEWLGVSVSFNKA